MGRVPNSPFRFLASREKTEALCRDLEQCGCEQIEVQADRIVCRCPWLAEPIEIRWILRWWPDGGVQEDDHVVVTCGGTTRADVDVGALLHRPLDRPLATVLADQVVAACATMSWLPSRTNRVLMGARTGVAFTSATTTKNDCVALRLGVLLSCTITVTG